jgi:hypothetical protein
MRCEIDDQSIFQFSSSPSRHPSSLVIASYGKHRPSSPFSTPSIMEIKFLRSNAKREERDEAAVGWARPQDQILSEGRLINYEGPIDSTRSLRVIYTERLSRED